MIIAIWHSDVGHMTAFANEDSVDLIALLPEDRGGHGFWAAYRCSAATYKRLTNTRGVMWK